MSIPADDLLGVSCDDDSQRFAFDERELGRERRHGNEFRSCSKAHLALTGRGEVGSLAHPTLTNPVRPRKKYVKFRFLTMCGPKPTLSKTPGELPEPPSWLSKDLLALWEAVVPQLAQDVDLRRCDSLALANLLLCQHRLNQCEADISERGLIVKGHRGQLVKNPAASLARAYRDSLQRARANFGLTPLSRLKVTRVSGGAEDPLERARDRLRRSAAETIQ